MKDNVFWKTNFDEIYQRIGSNHKWKKPWVEDNLTKEAYSTE